MPRYGITLGYEKDKCNVCGFIKEVRFIYDRDNCRVVAICDICAEEHKDITAEQMVEKYGQKTEKRQIELLDRQQFLRSGFKLQKGKKVKAEEKQKSS